jgi:hypothetical protein
MPIRIRLTPLSVVVQTIRPKVTSTTANLCACAIPAPQQRQRSLPITCCALAVKRRRLPYAKRVADFMHRGTFIHVAAVRPEAQVAIVVGFGGGDARAIRDADGFAGRGVFAIAGDSLLHSEGDARVGVCLVCSRVGCTLESPCYGR